MIESHLSPQVIENIERNMRRASQESASPTVNSKTRPVSGDDKSITSSFSLSFLPDEAPVVTRNREEDCASLEHSPHHPSHSPASFEPISPMSSNTSSLHIGIIGVDGVVGGGSGGSGGVVGVDGVPRRRSLHVPDFSMSDSNFQLLSPSHVSSGWEGPPSQSKLQQPTSSEGTTPLTNLSPETSPIMSPTSQKKEKVKSSWKFWKKNKEKLKEIDGNGMVDVESMSSPTMSDSSLASSSPPVTRPNPIATMPTPITMPMQVKSQAQKAATMPIPNHTTNINTIHTTTAMTAAMNDTSVSINNNDTNRQQMSPAIPARPKVSTPKNKLSPKGGSTGREGVHKRQKCKGIQTPVNVHARVAVSTIVCYFSLSSRFAHFLLFRSSFLSQLIAVTMFTVLVPVVLSHHRDSPPPLVSRPNRPYSNRRHRRPSLNRPRPMQPATSTTVVRHSAVRGAVMYHHRRVPTLYPERTRRRIVVVRPHASLIRTYPWILMTWPSLLVSSHPVSSNHRSRIVPRHLNQQIHM